MITIKFQYPLQWPRAYPRTQVMEKSINQSFKSGLTIQEALTFLYEELTELGVRTATLFSDYEHIEKPQSIRKLGTDNGVTLHFEMSGVAYRLACDRWVPVEQNIYALHLALRNLRSIVMWGVGNVEQAFGGYAVGVSAMGGAAASAAGNGKLEEWRMFLGLGPTATLDDAQAVYRRRAKTFANNEQELMRLNLAMEEAGKVLG